MMLKEHLRELKYTAQMASVDFNTYASRQTFGFTFRSYNQNYKEFFAEVFREL